MKKILLSLSLVCLFGCGRTTSFVRSDTTLGRVVVYRNGVAYFERDAEIDGDSLRLSVPGDKIDDFLKSLTVIDATTGKPAPIAYPTHGSAFVGNEQSQNQQSRYVKPPIVFGDVSRPEAMTVRWSTCSSAGTGMSMRVWMRSSILNSGR